MLLLFLSLLPVVLGGLLPIDTPGLTPEAFLEAHNKRRCLHGVPDMVWDDAVAKSARAFASQCVFAHSSTPNGENLYVSWGGSRPTADAPVGSWYNEIKDYNFASPGYSSTTGHFTQVVWADSTKLGCGVCEQDTKRIIVCQYSGPGNYGGQFPTNVKPLTGKPCEDDEPEDPIPDPGPVPELVTLKGRVDKTKCLFVASGKLGEAPCNPKDRRFLFAWLEGEGKLRSDPFPNLCIRKRRKAVRLTQCETLTQRWSNNDMASTYCYRRLCLTQHSSQLNEETFEETFHAPTDALTGLAGVLGGICLVGLLILGAVLIARRRGAAAENGNASLL